MTAMISVYIVAADESEAARIAEALIAARLAACVNILPPAQSLYRWQGRIVSGREVPMLAKTRAELFDALEARVKALHSYTCPCIVAWPIMAGHAPYLEWVAAETETVP